ncbi:MAG: lamin tail domain-containing protein [Planctomycetota bacterium]
MLPIFEDNPAWSGGVLYSSIWFSVEVPAITSDYLTLRVQCHIAEGGEAPGSWEPQYMSDVSTFVDGFRCDADFWIDPAPDPVDNVLILEHTVSRDEGACNPIMAAGGYIDYGEFTGIIVDIIVHDTPAPPENGPRVSDCFIPDTESPTPDPATWEIEPVADGPWSITMTATEGSDRSNIKYYFEETSGNQGGTSSSWQSSNSYTDQFLNPQTQYTYRVRMRDMSPNQNTGDWSTPLASATTDEIPSGECPDGDLDDDCDCDGDDLLIFALQWLDPHGCAGHPNDCADLNEQDGVDGADFAILVANWQDAGAPVMLVINELMASNSAIIADEHGEYDDWIEIYNPGPSAVLMSGMFIEDDSGFRWEVPPNIGINSGEYLVFWADDGWPDEGNFHTNFKLGKDGDGVTLYDTDGTTIIDAKSFSSMDTNVSYGRYADATDNWYDMADATPGATNAMGMSGKVYFSRQAGIFTSSFSLGLTAKSPVATIRYTTNGNEPNESVGQVYTGLIPITNTAIIRAAAFEPGYSRGPVKTKTYLSLADVYSQPVLPTGFPDVWHEGYPVNYRMYPPVVTEYAAELGDAFTSIPSLSIVMNMDDLFSQETGIYPNSMAEGVAWERPASAELIFADDSEGFDINCGIRTYGDGSSMPWVNLKHSFRLLFKGIYGPTKLDYALFEDSSVTQFDTIILRGGSNHCWANREESYERENAEYIRDIFARDTQLAMGQLSSHGNFAHLYLNGVYWGLYNPSERPDAGFLSAYYGGEKDDWDAMNSGEMVDGNREAWNTMMGIAEDGLETQAAYDQIQEYLDVDNLITYMIINHYIGNVDWSEKNWYAGRLRETGAGYRVFSWDAELSIFDPDVHGDEFINNLWHNADDTPQRLFHQLLDNPEFRLLYADHLHRHLFNGGALTPGSCIERYTKRADEIYTAIIGESARWGDHMMETHGGLPYTRDDDWIASVNYILDDYMPFRSDILLDQYRAISLYPDVDAPVFNINGSYQHGGYVPAGASLTITKSDSGTIYYTTDGSDPRLQGGSVSGSASSSLPYTLNDTKQIKTRVKDGSNWSALNEATYAVGDVANKLRITEIMYNVNDPNHEYIELKNIGGSTINLNLVKFTDGIDFTFPSLSLPAGGYCVAVRNAASFALRYPGFSGLIAGEFAGAINNGGERITLVNALGETILDFRFKDGWYPITDGEDFSLNIIDPANPDPNNWEYARYWQPSSVAGGTPSDADTGHAAEPGDIRLDYQHRRLVPQR